MKYLAGVELGGTSCVAAISTVESPETLLQKKEFPTEVSAKTLGNLVDYLKDVLVELGTDHFKAIGIASFGPVDLNKNSPTYGFITSTTKPSWQYVDIVGVFLREFGEKSPVLFDTDVNPAAYGEAVMLQHSNSNVVYVSVGTGVGVGVYVNGALVHGLLHPEAGHMLVGQKPGDKYLGSCAFHRTCVEGMVNSKALAERAGVQASELSALPDSHEIWNIAGYYLGCLCVNLTYALSPDVIVFGGGIMKRNIIIKFCRETFKNMLNNYLDVGMFKTEEGLQNYIRGSRFGNNAGIIGALFLACTAAKNQ